MAWDRPSLPNFSTLHSWLLWVELVLLALSSLGLYAVISVALKRKMSAAKRNEGLDFPLWKRDLMTMFGGLEWRPKIFSTKWASWRRRFNALFPQSRSLSGPADKTVWTAEEEARVMSEQIAEHFKRRGGFAWWPPVIFAFVFVSLLALSSAWLPPSNVVTEHHVVIISRLPDGDFAYKSDEKPGGDTYRPCPVDKENHIDVDGILTQALGDGEYGSYIADYATWQERGTCRSILRPDWGFYFRDARNNFTYERVTP
jgi:hypothetical protein